ncbi:hypothetical protein [Bacillus infantis]|uniref:hypothetical protein n=1 Tax=Bacillus infantis TaxID=324767 RepID=UPI003CED4AEF
MGLFKVVHKIIETFVNSALENHERVSKDIDRAQQKASGVSNDRDLVDKYKQSSGADKVGYTLELEKRGYIERNDDGKFQRTKKKF